MIICKRCGTQCPDNAIQCSQCGIALVHQALAASDDKRARVRMILRAVTWVIVLIIAIAFGPGLYHTGNRAFLKYKLDKTTSSVTKECSGPVEASMPAAQKSLIETCMETNPELIKAKQVYDDATKDEPK